MRKAALRLLLALAISAALAATAGATTLKMAATLPDGSPWMREMRKASAEIEKRTDGRVQIKLYPGGVMGNDETVMRKIRAGQLQGGAFTSGALAAIYPETELYSLPLVFHSYDEVDYVREHMDPEIERGLEQHGFVVLAISDGGFAYLLSQKPIRSVDDLAGTKVWALESDVMSRTALDIAGVSPIALPLADVYTGLQTGLVDTVAAPPQGAIALQWHTKVKYLTDVPLMYLIGVVAVDAKAFGKLSPEDQATVREVVKESAHKLDRENREGDRNAKVALQAQGITFVTASSPAELGRWHAIAEEAIARLRKKHVYSDAMIDELQSLLAEYRKGEGGGAKP
jgi:TRAP-type C4-dicarboxylate transport system substrate-binding protein